MDRTIIRDLKRGKKRKFEGLMLTPLTEDVKLEVGDRVVVTNGRIETVTKIKEWNYLNRYKVDGVWYGKSNLLAKVKGVNVKYVDLEFLSGKNVFITCQPEVPDFTAKAVSKLLLFGGGKQMTMPLPLSEDKLKETAALLKVYFDASKQAVFGWNIKGLFTYMKYRTGIDFDIPGRIFDLKVMEAFCGCPNRSCPQTFADAWERVGELAKGDNWGDMKVYYSKVAYPLISKVLPAIETTCLVHTELKKRVFAHYEIEGQVNGRLRCSNVFSANYNPHTLSSETRDKLNPPDDTDHFVYFDFRHMEVSVLQWLSQDPDLGRILESGQDLYEGIWEFITKIKCNKSYRNICKSFFLPVVYGQGAASLAEKTKIPEKTAIKIVDRIYEAFPVALGWVQAQQNNLDEDNFSKDHFGRKRQFHEQQYRVRNFVVQSAASTVCLHKLVRLFEQVQKNNEAQIIFHVHDGYGMLIKKNNLHRSLQQFSEVLETEEEYYPGLRLRVSCQAGPKLNQLEKVEIERRSGG